MYLSRLAVTDFRSYAAAELSLEPGVSTLLGANGQGKTNLVEAVAYLSTLGSHRVATDAPLVRSGAQQAILRGAVTSADRESLVEIEINPGRANRARLNRAPATRPRQVLGVLRTVLFAPEDLALVKGDPDQRRRFLDDLLVASAPRYAAVRADYDRVLRQRTALLKSLRVRPGTRKYARTGAPRGPGHGEDGYGADGYGSDVPGSDAHSNHNHGQDGRGESGPAGPRAAPMGSPAGRTLDVWDEHLATAGAELLAARIRLTSALRPLVVKSYAAVSGQPAEAGLSYRQSLRGPGSGGPTAGSRSLSADPSADPASLPMPCAPRSPGCRPKNCSSGHARSAPSATAL